MEPRQRLADTPAVWSAAVLALALLGDALLYLVLPVHPEAFGVSTLWVGVLLSANRFVRLGVNYLMPAAARRIGLGALCITGALLAAGSTIGYAVLSGGVALLAARLAWGVSFSALRLANLGYATRRPLEAGRLLGWSYGISRIGPLFAVTTGAYLASRWGERAAFWLLGLLSAAGVLVACRLPASTAVPEGARSEWLPWPTRVDLAYFLVTTATDGIFTVTLSLALVQSGYEAPQAVRLGGAVIVLRRLASIVLSPLAGRASARWGVRPIIRWSLVLLAVSFMVVALASALEGLLLAAVAIPLVHALAPGVAAAGKTERRLAALSSLVTWGDLGAAMGALAGGSLLTLWSIPALYTCAAALVGSALVLLRYDFFHQHTQSRDDEHNDAD